MIAIGYWGLLYTIEDSSRPLRISLVHSALGILSAIEAPEDSYSILVGY